MWASSLNLACSRALGGLLYILRPAIAASLALVSAYFVATSAHAQVSIEWSTVVSSTGNAPNPWTGFGSVDREYRIMKFEFTNSQYAAFLNATDPDGTNPNSIWNSNMGSDARGGISHNLVNPAGSRYAPRVNMGDKPVNFVSWWDAARVSNWLHNGAQTYGSTDASATAPQNTGAYTLGTRTSGSAVARNPGSLFYVPTENEWYKAAYYNPTLSGGGGGYHRFGNGFDTDPTPVTASSTGAGSAGGAGNFANYYSEANWNGTQYGNVTTIGTNGGASYYGAFDMSGNLVEWNEREAFLWYRGLRGGGFSTDEFFLSSVSGSEDMSDTDLEGDYVGFRLASPVAVPEPSTWVMGAAGVACLGWGAWLRRKRA